MADTTIPTLNRASIVVFAQIIKYDIESRIAMHINHLEQIASIYDELDIIMEPLPDRLKHFKRLAFSKDCITAIGGVQ